ncbi:MAG: DUF2029 domain-containing protein, partial [Chloroflexi bacterium]|nr:DUF2029 domain-containing protein [Chloroflexota bacterium]
MLATAFAAIVALPDHRGDGTYYAASQLLLRGEAGPRLYDDDWMRAQILAATQGRVSDVFTPNPPTATLLALPVAFFSPDVARRAWAIINAIVLIGSLGLLLHERDAQPLPLHDAARNLPVGHLALALTFAFFASPVTDGFRLGQAYIILLGLYVLAWLGVKRGWSWATGLSLSLALLLKASGAPLWLLLIARRQWRSLGWGMLGALIIFGVTLGFIGMETWRVYMTSVLPRAAASPTIAVTAYQSLAGYSTRLFRYDATWNPSPLADWPTVATMCALLSGLTVIVLTLILTRRAPMEIAFGVMAAASIFLVPYAEQHHYTLAVLPLWVAIGEWEHLRCVAPAAAALTRRSYAMRGAIVLIAALLIALPLPFKSPSLANGWWALFAYPRLYGGLMLWAVLLR